MVGRALWNQHIERMLATGVEVQAEGPPVRGGRVLTADEIAELEEGIQAVLGGHRYRVTVQLTEEPPPDVGRFHAHAITLLADLIATLRATQAEVDDGG